MNLTNQSKNKSSAFIPKPKYTEEINAVPQTPYVLERNSFVHINDLETAPDVKNVSFLELNNSGATTVTDFMNGQESQVLALHPLNGNTTIKNNARIKTNTGTDKLLTAGLIYRFTYWVANGTNVGSWHEDA